MASPAQINPDLLNSQPWATADSDPITHKAKGDFLAKRLSPGFETSIVYVPLEYKKDFVDLMYNLVIQYDPATITEQILLEKMAHNHWNFLRAIRYQSATMRVTIGKGVIPDGLNFWLRYQNTNDRAFHKTLAELLKLQKERKKSEIGFESQKVQPPAPVPPTTTEVKAEPPQTPPVSTPPATPAPSKITVPPVEIGPSPEISPESVDEMAPAVGKIPPGRRKAA